MKKYFKLYLIITLAIFSRNAQSQTPNEAAELFNDAIRIVKSDPVSAISKFEKCIKICDSIGSEAAETKRLAESRLPGCYYRIAYREYQKKNLENSIELFKKTAEIAKKYGDSATLKKAELQIPRLYLILGTAELKNKNYDKALSLLMESSKLDPTYAKAYYGQSLTYREKGDYQKAAESAKKAIEAAKQCNDPKTLNKAESLLKELKK